MDLDGFGWNGIDLDGLGYSEPDEARNASSRKFQVNTKMQVGVPSPSRQHALGNFTDGGPGLEAQSRDG